MDAASSREKEELSKLDATPEHEQHDSGCEQSPTTLSPPIPSTNSKCLDSSKDMSSSSTNSSQQSRKVYDREELLELQFVPLSLNSNADELLWPDYVNDGLFNPEKWRPSKDQPRPSSIPPKKDVAAEAFKPMFDPDALRPQRKSFVSGCQMRSRESASPSSDKSVTNGDRQHNAASVTGGREGDTKEHGRTRPVPPSGDRNRQTTGSGADRQERRVGSGRLFLERSDRMSESSRPASGNSTYPQSTRGNKQSSDRRENWRQRDYHNSHTAVDSMAPTAQSHSQLYGRDKSSAAQYNNRNHRSHHPYEETEPEWFTEDVSIKDTIELRGFETTHADRETGKTCPKSARDGKKAKNISKSKENKKPAQVSEDGKSLTIDLLTDTEPLAEPTDLSSVPEYSDNQKVENPISDSNVAPNTASTASKDQFDFNSFLNMNMPGISSEVEGIAVSDQVTSSRFSRWFKTSENESSQSTTDSANRSNTNTTATATTALRNGFDANDELRVDAKMTSFVQCLLSPGDDLLKNSDMFDLLDSPKSGRAPPLSDRSEKSAGSGAALLQMLQKPRENGHPPSQPQTPHQNQQTRHTVPGHRELSSPVPDILSKLLIPTTSASSTGHSTTAVVNPPETTTPALPTQYKTLEELEAESGVESSSHTNGTKQNSDAAIPITSHHRQVTAKTLKQSSQRGKLAMDKSTSGKQEKQEMAAFNKLLTMLQTTGELNKQVPEMPEITNSKTPNQLKAEAAATAKSSANAEERPSSQPYSTRGSTDLQQQQMTGASPHLPSSLTPSHYLQDSVPLLLAQHSTTQPSMLSKLTNQLRHTPPHSQQALPHPLTNLPAAATATGPLLTPSPATLQPNVSFNPAASTAGGVLNLMPNTSAPVNITTPAAAATATPVNIAAAIHASVNPLLQQTLQQRQKLPSPIMFGTQPPIHIAAPAPIHPMGPPAAVAGIGGGLLPHHRASPVQIVDHRNVYCQQQTPAASASQGQIPLASMAFTPTSVIRKVAHTKVDERVNEGQQLSQLLESLHTQGNQHNVTHNVMQNSAHNPALSAGHTAAHNVALIQQANQQQRQQPQHLLAAAGGMRPIVKHNTNQTIADQLLQQQQQAVRKQQTLFNNSVYPQQQNIRPVSVAPHQPPPSQQDVNLALQQLMLLQNQQNINNPQNQPPPHHQPPQPHHQPPQPHHQLPQPHQAVLNHQQPPPHQVQGQRTLSRPDSRSDQASNDNDIFKWFTSAMGRELPAHGSTGAVPIPQHASILTLDDIEH